MGFVVENMHNWVIVLNQYIQIRCYRVENSGKLEDCHMKEQLTSHQELDIRILLNLAKWVQEQVQAGCLGSKFNSVTYSLYVFQ